MGWNLPRPPGLAPGTPWGGRYTGSDAYASRRKALPQLVLARLSRGGTLYRRGRLWCWCQQCDRVWQRQRRLGRRKLGLPRACPSCLVNAWHASEEPGGSLDRLKIPVWAAQRIQDALCRASGRSASDPHELVLREAADAKGSKR